MATYIQSQATLPSGDVVKFKDSVSDFVLYGDESIEEITDPTIVGSLVEASTLSDNGYFIYDDGTTVYKVKGSTLRKAIQANSVYYEQYSAVPSSSNSGYWRVNVKKDGYTVISYSVHHGWSGSTIAGNENYSHNTGVISGYCGDTHSGELRMIVDVFYMRTS